MSTLSRQAETATKDLLPMTEDKLFSELGKRMRVMQIDQSSGGQFAIATDTALEELGFVEDFTALGRRYFQRVNRQIYQLVCGPDGDDLKEREELLQAFGIGKDAVAPLLAAVLVAHLGFAPAIAAVLATLAIRLFFKPGYQATCDTWKDKLPKLS